MVWRCGVDWRVVRTGWCGVLVVGDVVVRRRAVMCLWLMLVMIVWMSAAVKVFRVDVW